MPQKNKKPANTGKIQAKRSPEGKFLPGVSGNPAGKPPGAKSFTTKLRDALVMLSQAKDKDGTYMSYEAALVKTMLKKAIVDENVDMIKYIVDRLDGKPIQPMDHSGEVAMQAELDAETKAKIDNIFNRNMRRPK